MLTAMRKILIASIFAFTFCAFAFGQNSNCPTISMTGPSAVPREGEHMTFSVRVDEKTKDLNLKYVWSVSQGKIVEGQGTTAITVEWKIDFAVTATVEIKGLPEGCQNTDSETIIYDPVPEAEFIDEFAFSDSKIDSTKFDKINTALNDDPSTQAYIIIYNDGKTSSAKIEQKEQQIRKIISEKNISPDRIIIVRGVEKENLIRFWLVPAGATPPTP